LTSNLTLKVTLQYRVIISILRRVVKCNNTSVETSDTLWTQLPFKRHCATNQNFAGSIADGVF
jgi:hypothetical protein